jgi:hypothetical protein
VPAARSSPIPAATDPDHARPLALRECPGLLERLAMIPGPRDRRVRRHPLASVLAVSAAAVLAGARSVTAIAEWPLTRPGRSWPRSGCAVTRLCFPHAAPAIQVTRRVRAPGSRWRTVTVYAVISLALGTASPVQLAGWLRGHWKIENRLHWVRDVTFSDDASHARTGSLPRVMASLRNLAIGALRLAGHPNLAAALRQTGRDPARPLTILGLAHP